MIGSLTNNGRKAHPDTQPERKLRRRAIVALAGAAVTAMGTRGQAATLYTWNGAGTDNLWTDATNWNGTAPVPSTSSNLAFAGTVNTSTSNNYTAGSLFGSINFSAAAGEFSLGGNAIVLNGTVTNSSSTLQTINISVDEAAATRTYTTGTTSTGGQPIGDLLINGVITDGGVTLAGAGQTTLAGTNTYTGVTTINAGTTIVSLIGNGGTASNLGAATNAAANLVFAGGTLRYTGAAASTDRSFTVNGTTTFATFDTPGTTLTLTGGGTGTGGIGKIGTGTLVLAGANTNTGTTDLDAGTLKLDYSAATAPASILNSGNALTFGAIPGNGAFQANSATLRIQGGSTSAAVTQAFGLISTGVGGTSGHIVLADTAGGGAVNATFTGLTLFNGQGQRGSIIDITEGSADSVTLGSTGVSNVNGVINGEASGAGVTLNQTYWANLSGSTSGTVIAATETNDVFSITNNTNVTTSEPMASANTIRFDSSVNNTDIAVNIAGAATRTNGILEPITFGAHAVTISATGVGTLTGPNLRSFEIVQDNTAGDMTISAPIAGTNINKSGPGRLILSSTASTYAGNTYIDEGTLQISSNANLGQIGGAVYATTAPQPGNVYDDGTLEVRGGSTVTFDGSGGVSGIAGRSLTVGANGGTVDVDAPTTLSATGGVDVNVAGSGLPVSGALTKTGLGTLILPTANNSAGGLIVNAGTVVASASGAAFTTGAVTKQAVSGVTATGAVGASTVTITNASLLTAGQLITGTGIPNNTTISSISGTTVTLSNALTAAASGGGYVVYANPDAVTTAYATGNTALVVAASNIGSIQVGQIVTGTNIPSGAVVTAVNTATNTVTINLAATGAGAVGTILAFGGTNQYTVASTTGLALGNTGGQSGVQGQIVGIQGNVVTTGLPNTLVAANTNFTVPAGANYAAYDSLGTGPVTVNAGTLDLGGIAHLPVRAVTLTGGTIQNGTITGTSYSLLAGTVSANLAGPGVAMTKSTTGSVTLSGINTFTGPTTLTGGTLNLTGSLAAGSAVSVGSGSTLTGTGTAAGTVAVAAGGTLIPGTSGTATGVLNTGALTLDNVTGSTVDFTIDSDGTPTDTSLLSSGAISLGSDSTLSVADIGVGALSNSVQLVLFSGSSVSGTFLGLPEGAVVTTGNANNVYTIDYRSTSVVLNGSAVAAVPEPASLGLLAVGGLGLMRRRRITSSLLV